MDAEFLDKKIEKDFYNDLPGFVCESLDSIIKKYGDQPWFLEAWNEYAATTKPGTSADYGKKEEERVITGVEQTTAQALGEVEPGKVTRTDHSGSYVWVNGPTSNKPIE